MRVKWIEHKEKKILFVDYSNVKSKEKMIEILEEFHSIIGDRNKPLNRFLILSDVTKAITGSFFFEEAKRLGLLNESKLDKSAILGASGLKGVMLKYYNMTVKPDNHAAPFDTKEQALDYLVSES